MNKILYHPTLGTTCFFLVRNVPKIPIEPKNFETKGGLKFELGGDFGYSKAISKYNEALKACKEEAIKNGEIVNPEVLPLTFVTTDITSYFHKHKELQPGDMFDVPEGLEFVKGLVNGKNYVRLVPSKKEEMSYADKRKGVRKKSDWLKQCLKDGWTKDQLDGLSDLWDKYKDEVGNLKPESKSESQEALYTKDELIDAISAYSICPSDFTVEETKKDFPHQFKGKREHVTKWLKDNFTITRKEK